MKTPPRQPPRFQPPPCQPPPFQPPPCQPRPPCQSARADGDVRNRKPVAASATAPAARNAGNEGRMVGNSIDCRRVSTNMTAELWRPDPSVTPCPWWRQEEAAISRPNVTGANPRAMADFLLAPARGGSVQPVRDRSARDRWPAACRAGAACCEAAERECGTEAHDRRVA